MSQEDVLERCESKGWELKAVRQIAESEKAVTQITVLKFCEPTR